jgi:hypothetical protein
MTNKPLIYLNPDQLSEAQQDCVDKLREALEQAEAGNIHTVGIVCCMKTGYASTLGGTNASELNLGLDSLKRKILDAVEKAPSPILRS